jgi:NADH-quinone oxidoreductase subunit E
MSTMHKTTLLSDGVRAKIDHWKTRFPQDKQRSAVIQALMYVQEENQGFLTESLMDAVADYLGMPRIQVYEVVSFYTLFNINPVGQHTISVCTNISCMLAGSEKIVDHLKKRLRIDVNSTTADGKFTLREVECLAACTVAPMFQIGRKYYEHLTPQKVDAILDELE